MGNETNIGRVYSERTRVALSKRLDIADNVFTDSDLGNPALAQAEILFSTWGMPALSETDITRFMPNLKIVFYAAGSVRHFAQAFLNAGVRVVSAWSANAIPVAEFTFSQIILSNKGYFQAAAMAKSIGYAGMRDYSMSFPGTYGCATGIIGVGMVGRRLIEMLNACGIQTRILVFDPFLTDEAAESLNVKKCPLDELFKQCQTISNHLADNAQTKNMLGYPLFSLMKQNATFINTGRGAQVVEADLIRALREFPGRTALLDVTDPEPPEPIHPFHSMPNVFLSSHIAGSMGDETHRMGGYMLEELERYIAVVPLRYEVVQSMFVSMA